MMVLHAKPTVPSHTHRQPNMTQLIPSKNNIKIMMSAHSFLHFGDGKGLITKTFYVAKVRLQQ
jgi:hypothetical protein